MCRVANGDSRGWCESPGVAARRGMTMIELVMAITISAVIVATLGALGTAVRQNADFNEGQSASLQHARVTLQRIENHVTSAYATEIYPGVVVVDAVVGSYRYPDTLVIWKPANGTPVNAAGPPLVNELVLICPDPSAPTRLVEITAPADTRTIELNEASLNTTSGRSLVSGIKTASTSVKTQLTPLLRSASTGSTSGNTALRGAVRFECELHPTAAELSVFRSGTGTWSGLAWPQGVQSKAFGMRQVWLRSEIQLTSRPYRADGTLPADAVVLPFFGSAAMFYGIQK